MEGRIRGIAEIVLWVADMARSLDFYQGTLGLQRMSPVERPGPVFLRAGAAALLVPQMVVLVQLPPGVGSFEKPRPLHHLAFEVAAIHFDDEKARLESVGFTLRTGTHPIIPSRTIYLDDPDGNEVEIICGAAP